ncbi:MAG: tail fiber protein [Solirubrobacteraceae bacterium]|nr:tail fiber protein [Patulibacter sp.]
MSSPFVAEIRIFACNFAPKGWALCNGQLLPLSQNTALFSLLGTTYGGDGKSTFALPDLQGQVPMHPGQGPGLSLHDLGEASGTDTVGLLQTEIPNHTHTLQAAGSDTGVLKTPSAVTSLARANGGSAYAPANAGSRVTMNTAMIAPAGGGLPHNNLQPYQTLNFCIALQGVFPPRG